MSVRLVLSVILITAAAGPLAASEARASDILASSLAPLASDGLHAPLLRRLIVGLRDGSVTVAEAEGILRSVAAAEDLVHGRDGAVADRRVRGGVPAVEAVLAGEEPPAPGRRPAAPPPDPDLASGEETAERAAPPYPIVAVQPGQEDRPDSVLIEGPTIAVNDEWEVYRDGEPVVQVRILKVDEEQGLALGIVLAATWSDEATDRQVRAGEFVWPVAALEDEAEPEL